MRNDLKQLTTLINPYFTPVSFMEVGSRDGKDTKLVCEYWAIAPKNAYIIEANIFCYENILSNMISNGKTPYANLINAACSNNDGMVDFNCVISNDENIVGVSSLKKNLIHTLFYKITKVKAFRLETMLKETPIELFKIDAEGHGFEVLEGMGNEINNVKAIQIETEKDPNFEYQKLDSDVHQFLTNFGFELIDKTPCWTSQFDCLYINKNII
jgi:FkbM family methyltransferase